MPSEGLVSFVQMAQRYSLPIGYFLGGRAYEEQKMANVFSFLKNCKNCMLSSFVRLQKKTRQAEAEKAAAGTGRKTHDHIKGNSQTFAVDLRR